MATVLERVSTLIVDKLGVDAESIKPEATFAEDLNADSLDLVELIMAFEEQFSSDDVNIEISDEGVVVHRSIGDGYEVVGAPLPAVVSVTNELGEPRYPNLRGIMQASRKAPIIWSREDIGLGNDDLSSKVYVEELYIPVSEQTVEMIEGEDDEDSGRKLALRLIEEKLI